MPKADVFLRRSDGSLEQVAFGEADGHAAVAGLEVRQTTTDEKEIPLPQFVQFGLKRIASNPEYAEPGVQVKLTCLPGKTNPVFTLPVVIDEDGVIASDQLFEGADGSKRQRRACFVEMSVEPTQLRYLLIVEGRTRSTQPEILATTKLDAAEAVLLKQNQGC